MRLGEVWIVDLPPSDGREQIGRRPAIVVQGAQSGNGAVPPLVSVVPVSSRLASARFSSTVIVAPHETNGLKLRSVALVFQIRSLDRVRFVGRLGTLSDADLAAVRTEVRYHFGL